jgi:hypothetical protein
MHGPASGSHTLLNQKTTNGLFEELTLIDGGLSIPSILNDL